MPDASTSGSKVRSSTTASLIVLISSSIPAVAGPARDGAPGRLSWCTALSAGDVKAVDHVADAGGHPASGAGPGPAFLICQSTRPARNGESDTDCGAIGACYQQGLCRTRQRRSGCWGQAPRSVAKRPDGP